MTLSDLLALAKDYRGEGETAKNPFTGESMKPRIFSIPYTPLGILVLRLRYANCTSFPLPEAHISNTTCNGQALLSQSQFLPDGGTCTWSNCFYGYSDYTKFFMSLNDNVGIVTNKDWPELGPEKQWWFVINACLVCIHYKKLSDGSFELEFLDPRWIAGHIPS